LGRFDVGSARVWDYNVTAIFDRQLEHFQLNSDFDYSHQGSSLSLHTLTPHPDDADENCAQTSPQGPTRRSPLPDTRDHTGDGDGRVWGGNGAYFVFPLCALSSFNSFCSTSVSFLFISLISLSLFSPFALVLFFDFLPFSARSDYHPFPHLFL
jgi:hypothetical protein